jgi:hypothetical protein
LDELACGRLLWCRSKNFLKKQTQPYISFDFIYISIDTKSMILFIFLLIVLGVGGLLVSSAERMRYLALSMASLMTLFWWISFQSGQSRWCQVAVTDATAACNVLAMTISLLNGNELQHLLIDESLRTQFQTEGKSSSSVFQLAVFDRDRAAIVALLNDAKAQHSIDYALSSSYDSRILATIYANVGHSRRDNVGVELYIMYENSLNIYGDFFVRTTVDDLNFDW